MSKLGVLCLTLTATLLIMQLFLAQTVNTILFGASDTFTQQTRMVNGTRIEYNFRADASSLLLKWGIYPIYVPAGMYMFKFAEYFLYGGLLLLFIDFIRSYGKPSEEERLLFEEG